MIVLPMQYGDGVMGTPSDETIKIGRFTIPDNNLSLLFLRVMFIGGTLLADLAIHLDVKPIKQQPKSVFKLFTWLDVGATKQINARFTDDERDAWQFMKSDQLVLEWTNPEIGTISWVAQLGLTNGLDSRNR